MDPPGWAALAAALPLVALGVLVLATRASLELSAWAVVALAAVLAVTLFGLGPGALLLTLAKGGWTGVWILLIVVPALLLYQVMDSSGALDVLSDAPGHRRAYHWPAAAPRGLGAPVVPPEVTGFGVRSSSRRRCSCGRGSRRSPRWPPASSAITGR